MILSMPICYNSFVIGATEQEEGQLVLIKGSEVGVWPLRWTLKEKQSKGVVGRQCYREGCCSVQEKVPEQKHMEQWGLGWRSGLNRRKPR